MAVCNHRKLSAFEKGAQHFECQLIAVGKIVTQIRRLVAQVAWIVMVILTLLGLVEPDLLSAVTDAIAR